MDAALGFLALTGCVLLAALGSYAVHVLVRPREGTERKASNALSELEPRGGRHRFSVRFLEVGLLIALWTSATGALFLWVPVARELRPFGAFVTLVVGLSAVVGTWWAWRRGALRPPGGAPKPPPALGEGP